MKTELSQVVDGMSQVSIPKELLEQINMNELLTQFRSDYDQLDDLKKVREKHEERSFLSRWWNKDELEDAQLSATELQASFSKKLGQLMVLSVAQSQQLNTQQHEMSAQQQIIKQQAEDLAFNNEELKNQQIELEKQNFELDKLVNEYFELKGLTQDGAIKLIKIAKKVENTENILREEFEQKVQEIEMVRKWVLSEQETFLAEQTTALNSFQMNSEDKLELALKQFEDTTAEFCQSIEQSLNEKSKELDVHKKSIMEKFFEIQQSLVNEKDAINLKLSSLQVDYEQLQKEQNVIAEKHGSDLETLTQHTQTLASSFDKKELDDKKTIKTLIWSFSGIILLLTAALGNMAYKLYF